MKTVKLNTSEAAILATALKLVKDRWIKAQQVKSDMWAISKVLDELEERLETAGFDFRRERYKQPDLKIMMMRMYERDRPDRLVIIDMANYMMGNMISFDAVNMIEADLKRINRMGSVSDEDVLELARELLRRNNMPLSGAIVRIKNLILKYYEVKNKA